MRLTVSQTPSKGGTNIVCHEPADQLRSVRMPWETVLTSRSGFKSPF